MISSISILSSPSINISRDKVDFLRFLPVSTEILISILNLHLYRSISSIWLILFGFLTLMGSSGHTRCLTSSFPRLISIHALYVHLLFSKTPETKKTEEKSSNSKDSPGFRFFLFLMMICLLWPMVYSILPLVPWITLIIVILNEFILEESPEFIVFKSVLPLYAHWITHQIISLNIMKALALNIIYLEPFPMTLDNLSNGYSYLFKFCLVFLVPLAVDTLSFVLFSPSLCCRSTRKNRKLKEK